MADSELTLCSLSKPEKYIKLFRTFYEINDLAKLINRVITVTKLLLLLYFWNECKKLSKNEQDIPV